MHRHTVSRLYKTKKLQDNSVRKVCSTNGAATPGYMYGKDKKLNLYLSIQNLIQGGSLT